MFFLFLTYTIYKEITAKPLKIEPCKYEILANANNF